MTLMRAQLGSVTIEATGCTSDYVMLPPGVGGLGTPGTRTTDLERQGTHGSVAGVDYYTARPLTVPVLINRCEDNVTPQPDQAMAALRALKRAWRARDTDQELVLTIPGYGTAGDVVSFFGRARSDMAVELGQLYGGVIKALCTFVALDPLGYGPAVTSGATVTNQGDEATDRATITITAAGGTPVLLNPADSGGDISWRAPITGTRVIDLRTHEVTDGGGVDCSSEVATSSLWFTFQPGVNALTVTGTSSISVEHRPAYL